MKLKVNKKWLIPLMIMAILSTLCTFTGCDSEGYRTISIFETEGRVGVVAGGLEYSAYVNMHLKEGNSIVTSNASFARMVLDDDKYVKLEEGSKAVFEACSLGKTAINIERGSLTCEVVNPLRADEEYIIKTPSAILAVRGTMFRVDVDTLKDGTSITNVSTYGGTVTSQRILPSGELVDEEIAIKSGYKACVSMDEIDTVYVVDNIVYGSNTAITPSVDYIFADISTLQLAQIKIDEIPDTDLVDIYHASNSGHEMFTSTDEIKEVAENRDIKIEEQKSVYEKAETVKAKENSASDNTVKKADKVADDSKPLELKPETSEDSSSSSQNKGTLSDDTNTEKPTESSSFPTSSETIDEEDRSSSSQTDDSSSSQVTEESSSSSENDTTEDESSSSSSSDENTSGGTVGGGAIGGGSSNIPPAQTHTHTEETTEVDATCTENGYIETICSTCGETITTSTIPATGHTDGTPTTTSDATCITDGATETRCTVCNEVTATGTISATGHTPADTNAEITTCSICNTELVKLSTNNFPDSVFLNYLSSDVNFEVANDLADTYLSTEEMNAVTLIDLGGDTDNGITDLSGISRFTNLSSLSVRNNAGLTFIDIASNTHLQSLDVSGTGITDLVLNGGISSVNVANAPLTSLTVSSSNITELDVSTNTALTSLLAANVNIETIDVSNNTNLQILNVSGNSALTSLDLSRNSALTSLNVANTNITSLNVSGKTALSNINVNYCTRLTSIDISNTALTEINVSSVTNLVAFIANNTDIAYLNLSNKSSLNNLDVGNCTSLTTLNVANCTALSDITNLNTATAIETLNLSATGITTLNTATLPALTSLNVSSTNLTALDVSSNSELTSLNVMSVPLQSLFAQNTKITELNLAGNTSLVSLNIANCTSLSTLNVNNCSNLANLDVYTATELINLMASGTKITTLDLSNNAQLQELDVSYSTELLSLDVSANANLYRFIVYNCGKLTELVTGNNTSHATLTSVDVSGLTSLVTLDTSYCDRIAEIVGLSSCTALETVNVTKNSIGDIDLRSNSALTSLNVTDCANLQNIFVPEGHAFLTNPTAITGYDAGSMNVRTS